MEFMYIKKSCTTCLKSYELGILRTESVIILAIQIFACFDDNLAYTSIFPNKII